MHSHLEQYLELTQVPQQSPPSKLQSLTLVSSLQIPLPTFAFVILLVRPVLHLHSEHNSLFTQGPQQSCPSKEQWWLLLKSWQNPSPISFGNWHAIFEEKQIFAYIRTTLTPDWRHVKRPPPSVQITSNFLGFYGLSNCTTLRKKCVAKNLTYSKIHWTISWNCCVCLENINIGKWTKLINLTNQKFK